MKTPKGPNRTKHTRKRMKIASSKYYSDELGDKLNIHTSNDDDFKLEDRNDCSRKGDGGEPGHQNAVTGNQNGSTRIREWDVEIAQTNSEKTRENKDIETQHQTSMTRHLDLGVVQSNSEKIRENEDGADQQQTSVPLASCKGIEQSSLETNIISKSEIPASKDIAEFSPTDASVLKNPMTNNNEEMFTTKSKQIHANTSKFVGNKSSKTMPAPSHTNIVRTGYKYEKKLKSVGYIREHLSLSLEFSPNGWATADLLNLDSLEQPESQSIDLQKCSLPILFSASASEIPLSERAIQIPLFSSARSNKMTVSFVGGPVLAMDWHPTFPFYALAAHPASKREHAIGTLYDKQTSLIQIWKLIEHKSSIHCVALIEERNTGAVWDLKWIPDDVTFSSGFMGSIMVAFADASIRVYKIPVSIAENEKNPFSNKITCSPFIFRMNQVPGRVPWRLAFRPQLGAHRASSKTSKLEVAAACTDGHVIFISFQMNDGFIVDEPQYWAAKLHLGCIRSAEWTENGMHLVTCGEDSVVRCYNVTENPLIPVRIVESIDVSCRNLLSVPGDRVLVPCEDGLIRPISPSDQNFCERMASFSAYKESDGQYWTATLTARQPDYYQVILGTECGNVYIFQKQGLEYKKKFIMNNRNILRILSIDTRNHSELGKILIINDRPEQEKSILHFQENVLSEETENADIVKDGELLWIDPDKSISKAAAWSMTRILSKNSISSWLNCATHSGLVFSFCV